MVTRPGNVNFVADTLSMLSKPVLANISTSISPSPASTSEIEILVISDVTKLRNNVHEKFFKKKKKMKYENMLVTVKYSKIKKKEK